MKVLWLTNTPVGASEYFNLSRTSGGWMSSLEAHIKKIEGLDLGVCFFYDNSNKFSFEHRSVTYYPVKTKNASFLGKVYSKLFNVINDRNLPHLLRVLDDFKPDVIQLFGTESYLGEVLQHTKVPAIIHIQGLINPCLEAWFPKGVTQLKLMLNSTLKNALVKKDFLGEYYQFKKRAVIEEKIIKSTDNYFGRTHWDKKMISLYNPKAHYYHCDELLREAFFRNEWCSKPQKKLRISTTINPNIYKGLEIILKTSALLKEKTELDFEWNVMGMNNTHSLIRVIERIEKKRFKNYGIVFSGYLSSEGLIKKLLSSDIFVHPSHIDNSPNSVCEAMLLGMPIIAGNVGGVSSLIEDKFNGLLYNSYDPYELAGLLLNHDMENAKKLGRNARKTAIERHDFPTIVETIHTTYKLLIAERQR